MTRPRIRITLIDRKGPHGCHRGHKIGDSFDFDTERGLLCPMAMHVAFPYIDILRYGGSIPGQEPGTAARIPIPSMCSKTKTRNKKRPLVPFYRDKRAFLCLF